MPRGFPTCCGWSRTTQPRSSSFAFGAVSGCAPWTAFSALISASSRRCSHPATSTRRRNSTVPLPPVFPALRVARRRACALRGKSAVKTACALCAFWWRWFRVVGGSTDRDLTFSSPRSRRRGWPCGRVVMRWRVCAGKESASIPPSLRYGATGTVHHRLNGRLEIPSVPGANSTI